MDEVNERLAAPAATDVAEGRTASDASPVTEMESFQEYDKEAKTSLTSEQEAALPPIYQDWAMWGMVITQLLGAFNDNLFKQMLLLLCVDWNNQQGGQWDFQALAAIVFAVPFVLLSGYAGYLSDRYPKRVIVVLSKIGEIGIMILGCIGFYLDNWIFLYLVLFLMGAQSAFFGPSKYGILPELFRERDLPPVNGLVQMTTFLAILFGTALAGWLKDSLPGQLYLASMVCVGIAFLGTGSAFLLRRTAAAQPDLEMTVDSLFISRQARRILSADRALFGIIVTAATFWFCGGVVLPAVNEFGKTQLQLSDTYTSLLACCLGVGISLGCLLIGLLSKHRIRWELVSVGAWGVVISLLIITGWGLSGLPTMWIYGLSFTQLLFAGVFAGIFVVPLQIFLQVRPNPEQRGQVIAAMNVFTWSGILASGIFYLVINLLRDWLGWPESTLFAAAALSMVPIALMFRAPYTQLHETKS